VVAGLKITDLCVAAGSVGVFGGTGDRNRGDGLVVGFDDDVFFVDFAQNSGERGGGGRVVTLACRLLSATGISPSRIAAARVSDAWAADDLCQKGKASQQDQSRK
jgi:class 3 adenylate cyclase